MYYLLWVSSNIFYLNIYKKAQKRNEFIIKKTIYM